MTLKHVVESKYFKVAAVTCGVLLVALISFAGGVKVGLHKAAFSARFGENYERNFLGMSPSRGQGMMSRFDADDRGMRNPHGVGGEILSIAGDTLVIKNRNNQESSVRISDATVINKGSETLKLENLVAGDRIIVVGKPGDDGVVAAQLVRVFDQNTAR